MNAMVRLGAMLLGVMLAFVWPAALAQGRHGQDPGRGGPRGGGQHHGGEQHFGGQHFGGQFDGGRHDGWAHHGGPPHWRGDVGRSYGHDWGPWRGGHWHHGYHGDRLGWWWIVGPAWYYYPQPVYPYPGPWAGPAQYWYYCPSSRVYYLEAPACPDWRQVLVPDASMLIPIPQGP